MFLFFWVGWWVGNWLPIDLSYERNGTTIKVVVLSRGLKFFFSRSFRYLLTKSIVRSRTSFFSVIKLQRINNPFNLALVYLSHTYTHTHTSLYLLLNLVLYLQYRIVFLSDYVKSRLTYESKLWDYRLDLSLPATLFMHANQKKYKKGKTNHAIGKNPSHFGKRLLTKCIGHLTVSSSKQNYILGELNTSNTIIF